MPVLEPVVMLLKLRQSLVWHLLLNGALHPQTDISTDISLPRDKKISFSNQGFRPFYALSPLCPVFQQTCDETGVWIFELGAHLLREISGLHGTSV